MIFFSLFFVFEPCWCWLLIWLLFGILIFVDSLLTHARSCGVKVETGQATLVILVVGVQILLKGRR